MKGRFLFTHGILAFGVPLAIAVNIVTVTARGDGDVFFSMRNAFELAFTLALVAPISGVLVGNHLWIRRRKRDG